jgi:hypothetical protein
VTVNVTAHSPTVVTTDIFFIESVLGCRGVGYC